MTRGTLESTIVYHIHFETDLEDSDWPTFTTTTNLFWHFNEHSRRTRPSGSYRVRASAIVDGLGRQSDFSPWVHV